MGTNFNQGISSFGVPVPLSGRPLPVGGTVWFVNTAAGADGNTGREPVTISSTDGPLATMARAFAQCGDNDVIYVKGVVREQIVAPLGVQGVVIVGNVGGRTRHDDGARWTFPATPTAATPLLTLREQGWEVHNLLMVPYTASGAIRLRREENATYPDASHAIISGCKFIADTGIGIEDYGGNSHVLVDSCEFNGSATVLTNGILNTNVSIANPLRWLIQNNIFQQVTQSIVMQGSECVIRNNVFGLPFSSGRKIIALAGGTGYNQVLYNFFNENEANMLISKGYSSAAATDSWRNYSNNVAAMTVGVPGA